MPVVGSSRSSSAGSDSSAMAKRSRCCSPPEHFATTRSARAAMPASASTSATGRVSAKRLAVSSTVSRTVRSLSRPPVCMTAETRPRAIACPRLEAEDPDAAGGGPGEPEDHVDRGGLPGAVRPEEGDDLALLELEVDPAHGVHGAEVLGDALDADRRGTQRGGGRGCGADHGPSLVGRGRPGLDRASRPGHDKCQGPDGFTPSGSKWHRKDDGTACGGAALYGHSPRESQLCRRISPERA